MSSVAARRWGLDRRGAAGTLAALLIAMLLAAVWGLIDRPTPLPDGLLVGGDSMPVKVPALRPDNAQENEVTAAIRPEVAFRPHALRPETTSVAGWQAIGLPQELARRIVAYRQAGGRVHTPEGFRRVYGLVAGGWWDRLSPYLIFDDAAPHPQASGEKYPKAYPSSGTSTAPTWERAPRFADRSVDINLADSAALEALPGIGPATAHRLIAYRRLLGGYVSLDQLYELYGQDSVRTRSFARYLYVGAGHRPQPVDWVRYGQDYRYYHPYLPRAQARALRAWARERTTPSLGTSAADLPPPRPSELVALGLLDSAGLARLRPYLP